MRGFSQVKGVDYYEIFASVNRLSSFRVLLAVATAKNMVLRHFDIEIAILYGHCDEEIYIQPPNGVNIAEGNVLGLHKCFYGLKQAQSFWHYTASTALRKLGFEETDVEPCLFERAGADDTYMLMQMYVDKLAVAAMKQAAVDAVFQEFSAFFCQESWITGVVSRHQGRLQSHARHLSHLADCLY